jgi:hypothetical protein
VRAGRQRQPTERIGPHAAADARGDHLYADLAGHGGGCWVVVVVVCVCV